MLRNIARRSARPTTTAAKGVAMAAVGIAVALGTAGCSSGQISQTANQLPAVNGASANHGTLALRDVQIIYPSDKADEVFGNGGPFQLSFVISNDNLSEAETLVSIDAPDGGTVTIDADSDEKVIPAGMALRAGKPVGILEPESGQATANEKRISVKLNGTGKTVAAGLTVPLVFHFQRAGAVTVNTPVDAGTFLVRQDKVRQAEAPAEGGH